MSKPQRPKNSEGNSERNLHRNSEKESKKCAERGSERSFARNSEKNSAKISEKNIKKNVEKSSERGARRSFEKDSDFVPFDDNLAKDFGFLVNAPVSEDDNFVFRLERSWAYDAPSFSEFFVLDLKKLSLALNATAFNEIVDIEEKYLTSDQVASLANEAAKFGEEFENLLRESEEDLSGVKDELGSSFDEEAEELDFLLSLKKPQPSKTWPHSPIAPSYSGTKAKAQSKTADSHNWLDFIFEDGVADRANSHDLWMLDE